MDFELVLARRDILELKGAISSGEGKEGVVIDKDPSPHGAMVDTSQSMGAEGLNGAFELVLVDFILPEIHVEGICGMAEHDVVKRFVAVGKTDAIAGADGNGLWDELKVFLVDEYVRRGVVGRDFNRLSRLKGNHCFSECSSALIRHVVALKTPRRIGIRPVGDGS